MADSEMFVDDSCGKCGGHGAEGQWNLCPSCRADMAAKHQERLANMEHPKWCMACHNHRPLDGGVYCGQCEGRFDKGKHHERKSRTETRHHK